MFYKQSLKCILKSETGESLLYFRERFLLHVTLEGR